MNVGGEKLSTESSYCCCCCSMVEAAATAVQCPSCAAAAATLAAKQSKHDRERDGDWTLSPPPATLWSRLCGVVYFTRQGVPDCVSQLGGRALFKSRRRRRVDERDYSNALKRSKSRRPTDQLTSYEEVRRCSNWATPILVVRYNDRFDGLLQCYPSVRSACVSEQLGDNGIIRGATKNARM